MARPPKKTAGKNDAGAAKKPRWTAAQKAAKKNQAGKRPHRKGDAVSTGAKATRRAEERRERFGAGNDARRDDRRDGPGRDGRREDRRDDRGGYRGGDDRRGFRGEADRRDDRGGYRGGDDRSGFRGDGDRRDARGDSRRDDLRRENRGFQGRDGRRDDRGFGRRDDRGEDRRDNRGRFGRDNTGFPGRDDRRDSRGFASRDNRRVDRAASGPSDSRSSRDGDDRRTERRDWSPRNDRSEWRQARGDQRGDDRRGRSDAGDTRGFRPRDDRRGGRHDGSRSDGRQWGDPAEAPQTWEDAEAERAEADTWVKYSGTKASGPAEVTQDNGFAAMGLPDVLVDRLARDGITEPFAIQTATIPDALAGKDLLGRAQTGSGKTLGFGLPLLTRLMGEKSKAKRPRAIILVPTRELAMQVNDALEPLAVAAGLRCRLVAGGLSYTGQINALDRGVDILIATPGRLVDLRERGAVSFEDVQVTVLDEADHMADMGFMTEVSAVLDEIPREGQRLLFSATLDNGVDKIVEAYLTEPVEHGVDDVAASVDTMSHFVFLLNPQDKKILTAELANRDGRTIVFVRTKLGADRVARELQERGVKAAALHGGLTQSVRNRVLGAFREGNLPVLVATDVAARGIHVDDVSLVLQGDPPADHKDYLHRSGRTARAGELGTVVTLALPHQRRTMQRMIEAAGLDLEPVGVKPGDPLVDAAGGSTPTGASVADEVAAILAPKGRGGRRGPGGRPQGGPNRFGRGSRSGEFRPPRNYRGAPRRDR